LILPLLAGAWQGGVLALAMAFTSMQAAGWAAGSAVAPECPGAVWVAGYCHLTLWFVCWGEIAWPWGSRGNNLAPGEIAWPRGSRMEALQ